MSGWDVVVHFNSKEDVDEFIASVDKNESVCIPGEFPDSGDFLEAAIPDQPRECLRSEGID